ncbi:MAG: hypothetical protein LBC97_01685 [Bifidobacteriaceae bacterium]|nr:hypothetical protein [Bifidobacteriaceae bacterium]
MSGDHRGGDRRDDQAPDFDARWRELAEELAPSLPPDLHEWASGQPHGNTQGGKGGQGGHVVWAPQAGEDADLDDPDGSGAPDWSGDLADLEKVEDSLDSDADTPVYGPRDWSPAEVEEHFEPPDPPPALAGDPLLVLAWIGLVGGLAAVFAWAIVGSWIPEWLPRAGLLGIVAGAATLIWKMPHTRDPEDDDDGAQV